MRSLRDLTSINRRQGQPVYISASEAVRQAVDSGAFAPGERMPSTKELAAQLRISLVTAHRALHELVNQGVLRRAQGKGTYVHERYVDRKTAAVSVRIGMIGPVQDTLEAFYRVQVMEGIRQAAHQLRVDLLTLGMGEDVRDECGGLLFVTPHPEQIEAMVARTPRKPALVLGGQSNSRLVSCIDIDNLELGRRAVSHLNDLGHRSIAFIGGEENIVHAHERWRGFLEGCQQHGIICNEQDVIRSMSWRLDERERMALVRVLSGPSRPTAIFAASYDFAMDVYLATRVVGLDIPRDLSLIGVDDTPSTVNLAPPMTTFRQPLIQLGHAGVTTLVEQIHQNDCTPHFRTLRAELMIRGSTGRPTVS